MAEKDFLSRGFLCAQLLARVFEKFLRRVHFTDSLFNEKGEENYLPSLDVPVLPRMLWNFLDCVASSPTVGGAERLR